MAFQRYRNNTTGLCQKPDLEYWYDPHYRVEAAKHDLDRAKAVLRHEEEQRAKWTNGDTHQVSRAEESEASSTSSEKLKSILEGRPRRPKTYRQRQGGAAYRPSPGPSPGNPFVAAGAQPLAAGRRVNPFTGQAAAGAAGPP